MAGRRLRASLTALDERELRLQVVVPLLRATPEVVNVTDVHGQNEKGLDVIFAIENGIERICYGLQLKQGNISGGGTSGKTVKNIIDQLDLASGLEHPIATNSAGTVKIDRYIVATSGKISETAREEIARRLKTIPVKFWDGDELVRRIHKYLPDLFQISDGASAGYLKALLSRFDVLDALDQIPGVAKRTLTQIYEEPNLKRIFDPSVVADNGARHTPLLPALSLLDQRHNAVIVGDQDGGKTSLIRMLAMTRARNVLSGSGSRGALPLVIRAADVLKHGSAIRAIVAELTRLSYPELAETLPDDLEAGNYFVAVDGFSELVRETDKNDVSAVITHFSETYPGVQVIIAARPVDFLSPRFFGAFYHYSIEDFDSQQSSSLIRRWVGNSQTFSDVGGKMVERLREALQLPGSPIPATIGVMLHEEQGRYITNTAEAIDRYMVIRLGRYAHELGMKQEVDWARKQDLLSEVAFEMVASDQDSIAVEDFVQQINNIQRRQGDEPRGERVLVELVDSGVLGRDGERLSFFRSSFRDFFAAQHVHQRGDLDQFALDTLLDGRWGGVIVFAAGLRRKNSKLLSSIVDAVEQEREACVDGPPGERYAYAAYLCGRVLANSESSDHGPKMAALATTARAIAAFIPEIDQLATAQYGNIGHLLGLFASEHSFFITIGVPWLREQLRELVASEVNDEERYLLASAYAHLGFPDCYDMLERCIRESTSTRVLVVLDILLWQLESSRSTEGSDQIALSRLRQVIRKRLAPRKEEVASLLEVKSQAIVFERERLRRLQNESKKNPKPPRKPRP